MKSLVIIALFMISVSCAHRTNREMSSEPQKKTVTTEKVIQYEGNCALGMCKKMKVKGDPQYQVTHKGKTYSFSSAKARDEFTKDIDRNIKLADDNWRTMSASAEASKQ